MTGTSNAAESLLIHDSTTYESPIDHKQLTVSFSTTSNFHDDNIIATALFLGPLMCSRHLLSYANELAVSKKIRVTFIDRPGFGSSSPVPVETRLQHVMACIPAVLSRLQVEYISLMSASAGTLYLLNFLATPKLRAYLHPQRPYVAAMVPWVHPEFSRSKLLGTAALLPAALIGSCGGLQRFVGTKIIPGIGWSAALFGGGTTKVDNGDPDLLSKTGMTEKQIAAVDDAVAQHLWAEDTSGLGHEALTCLRKNMPPTSWGYASSYQAFLDVFADQEAKRMQTKPESRLRFRVIFAYSDILIGDTGRKYVDDCFKNCTVLEAGVEYSSSIIPNKGHDEVIDVRSGAIASIFDDIAAIHKVDK